MGTPWSGLRMPERTMTAERRPVWIDTDPAAGVPGSDVDDALALIAAFHAPELAVRGVSSVFGNAPLDATHPIAESLCARFGPPGLCAYRGAASAAERTQTTEAVVALAAALEAEPLDILALGPMTNVAAVVEQRPELAQRIRSIVAVAGRRPGQEFRSSATQPDAFPDLNFECDADGMQILLDCGAEIVARARPLRLATCRPRAV